MKRMLTAALAVFCLLCLCPTGLWAAEQDALTAADHLYTLGLFSGTGTDSAGNPIYELDRSPTRHEAVTMLVRLLGKEQEALAGSWTTPFADVAEWAVPYVGYAYAHGLTAGVSATAFGGEYPVNTAQYITFILRALGYSSDTDFRWDASWLLSDQLGITDGRYRHLNDSFTRGDIALVSDTALAAQVKTTGITLLESLEQSGAVEPEIEDTIVRTDGKPIGLPTAVSYDQDGKLTGAAIHGYSSQVLDNGYTRFTLEYTAPKGCQIQIFDPPDGDVIHMRTPVAAGRGTLSFDLHPEQLGAVRGFTVSVHRSDSSRLFAYCNCSIPFGVVLSTGRPAENAAEVPHWVLEDTLPGAQLHSWSCWPLDNGYTRHLVEYTAPVGTEFLTVLDLPNGENFIGLAPAAPGRGTLVFDLPPQLADLERLAVTVHQDDSHRLMVLRGQQPAGESGEAPGQEPQLPLTDGSPAGPAADLPYSERNTMEGSVVHSYTAQPLDNGYTRFTLAYTIPESCRFSVFDPPNGDRFLHILQLPEGSGTLVFDLPNEALQAVQEVTASIHRDDNHRHFVFFKTKNLK